MRVGRAPPQQIVAVIRPACFTSPSKKLEQKHIVNMEGKEMVMVVKLADPNTKPSAKVAAKSVCSQRLFPTSRKGIGGLYIFSLGSKFPNLFKRAGTYNFSFSIVSNFSLIFLRSNHVNVISETLFTFRAAR